MLKYRNLSNLNQAYHGYVDSPETSRTTFIGNDVVGILQWIIWATLPQVIIGCGIVGNVINIICFVKQGFRDTVNVTFVGKLDKSQHV